MNRLHLMILRMMPGPFLGWLLVIMFLLLMQFLMKYLPDIAGKGLPIGVILELIVYNLAYMVVLAVPMAVLITNLMVYGRLAENRAFSVIKSAGISIGRIAWPSLVLAAIVAGGMVYFNHVVLPEANFRARNLWQDIRKKKPAFDLQAGAFYQGLNRYSILVQHVDGETNEMSDVLIYDYTQRNRRQVVIKAERGTVVSPEGGPYVDLVLENGELHTVKAGHTWGDPERYERLAFGRYRFRIDLDDFEFERTDPTQGLRSDRTMPTADMLTALDSLRSNIREKTQRLAALPLTQESTLNSTQRDSLSGGVYQNESVLDPEYGVSLNNTALQFARERRNTIDEARRTLAWEQQRANRYLVEIHKKYSIAIACLIFALVGTPIGISMRRGGLGMAGAAATIIFLFYWVSLVQGEKIADRGFVEPWQGMWGSNIILLFIGILAMAYVWLDLRRTPSILSRFRRPRR